MPDSETLLRVAQYLKYTGVVSQEDADEVGDLLEAVARGSAHIVHECSTHEDHHMGVPTSPVISIRYQDGRCRLACGHVYTIQPPIDASRLRAEFGRRMPCVVCLENCHS